MFTLICACGHSKQSHKKYKQAQNGFKWEDCFAIVRSSWDWMDVCCDCTKFRPRGIRWIVDHGKDK
jgi:hypothetical protein